MTADVRIAFAHRMRGPVTHRLDRTRSPLFRRPANPARRAVKQFVRTLGIQRKSDPKSRDLRRNQLTAAEQGFSSFLRRPGAIPMRAHLESGTTPPVLQRFNPAAAGSEPSASVTGIVDAMREPKQCFGCGSRRGRAAKIVQRAFWPE